MPEGDTIFRTAASIRKWMGGRVVTSAQSVLPQLCIDRLTGRTFDAVDAVGKHLLMTFDGSPRLILRTHMRMTGSWHVYSAADTWRRPRRQARLIIEAGDRLAVCFNAPIIDLLTEAHDAIGHLGPDILADPFEVARAVQRARSRGDKGLRALGEVLLDQRIVAGIGNIYRCESLFVQGLSPWTPVGAIDDLTLTNLLLAAEQLMKANLGTPVARTFGVDPHGPTGGLGVTWVYRRAGKPCVTCATLIANKAQGDQARMAYWCPTCQPVRSLP